MDSNTSLGHKQEFYIEMDDPGRSYFPGDTVSGRLVIESAKDKVTNGTGVTISFLGKASVMWARPKEVRVHNESEFVRTKSVHQKKSNEVRSVHRKYLAEEIYFDFSKTVLAEDGTETKICPGFMECPFSFVLPENIPASFKGLFGTVTYQIEAIMKMPNMSKDEKVVFPIPVKGILKLNSMITSSDTVILVDNAKMIGCGICTSGTVGFVMELKKTGYLLGENVAILVDIYNNSKRKKIRKSKFALVQDIDYHGECGKYINIKNEKREVFIVWGPSVGPGEQESWTAEFVIPSSLPVTGLGNRCIICPNYLLKVELEISGCTSNLNGTASITIGTTIEDASSKQQSIASKKK